MSTSSASSSSSANGGQTQTVLTTQPTTPPYLLLHSVPYSSIGVASPPSPRCYDIIEEEMIFPMSDITEEEEVLSISIFVIAAGVVV